MGGLSWAPRIAHSKACSAEGTQGTETATGRWHTRGDPAPILSFRPSRGQGEIAGSWRGFRRACKHHSAPPFLACIPYCERAPCLLKGVAVFALIGNYSTSLGARRPSPSRIHVECLYPPAVATLGTAYRALNNKHPNPRVLCPPTDGDIIIHRHHVPFPFAKNTPSISTSHALTSPQHANVGRAATIHRMPTPTSHRCSRVRGPYLRHPARCKHRFNPQVCRWPFDAWSTVLSTRCAFLGRWWGRAWLVDQFGLDWGYWWWCFLCWLLVLFGVWAIE